jgi:membrane-associated phospholipid phosphatase
MRVERRPWPEASLMATFPRDDQLPGGVFGALHARHPTIRARYNAVPALLCVVCGRAGRRGRGFAVADLSVATTGQPSLGRQRLARLLTEMLAPAPVVAVLILVVALHSAPSVAAGLGWAALTILFGALLPFAYILWGMRRGRLTDHHVRRREQRPLVLLAALAFMGAGFGALAALGAPRELLALVLAMAAGLVVSLLITLVWKLSGHTGAAAGTVAVLALIFGPQVLPLALLAAAVGWARVELGVHTPAQVVGGGLIGAAVATLVFAALR